MGLRATEVKHVNTEYADWYKFVQFAQGVLAQLPSPTGPGADVADTAPSRDARWMQVRFVVFACGPDGQNITGLGYSVQVSESCSQSFCW